MYPLILIIYYTCLHAIGGEITYPITKIMGNSKLKTFLDAVCNFQYLWP